MDQDKPDPDRSWALLTTVDGSLKAEMIASILRANDIPVTVWQESAGNYLPVAVGPLAITRIMVPTALQQEALNLINADFEGEQAASAICPHCYDEFDLDEEELANGWFICPQCNVKVVL